MFPWTVLIVNIVALIVVPLFAALLTRKWEVAGPTFVILFGISWVSWIVYIALHFLSKYW